MSPSPIFIWNAAAIALGVIGGALFLWAMFRDRPRGRLRCPRCWYDMKGAVEAAADGPWTCPECGTVAKSLGSLRRTRRRKRRIALALLLIFLAFQTDRVRLAFSRRWLDAIPNLALVVWPDGLGPWEDELYALDGIKTRAPLGITSDVQEEIYERLQEYHFSRLDTWILTQRIRALCHAHGMIDLSDEDLDAVERLNQATFTIRNGVVPIDGLVAALDAINLRLVDARKNHASTIPWQPRQLNWGQRWADVSRWPVPAETTVSLAAVLNGLATDEPWGVTADHAQFALLGDLETRVHIYDVRDLVNATRSADPETYWSRRIPRSEYHEAIRSIITESCLFEWWYDNGGEAGWITALGDRLIVDAPPRLHAEVCSLLAKMREAARFERQTPETTTRDMAELESLESMLIPGEVPLPRTIGETLALIENISGHRTEYRPRSSSKEDVLSASIDVGMARSVADLCDAVAAALPRAERFGCTWTTDHDAIAIGTELPTDVRMYSMKPINEGLRARAGDQRVLWDDVLYEVFIYPIEQRVAHEHWTDNDGDLSTIRCLGNTLIIRTTPTIHARVARLLEEIAASSPMPVTAPPEDEMDIDPRNRPFNGTFDGGDG